MAMSSEQLYPIIIINLSILLVASWCFAFIIIRKLSKANNNTANTKAKTTEKKAAQTAEKEAATENITETLDQLKDQFEEKKISLSKLESLHDQQKASLATLKNDNNQEAYDNMQAQLEKSEALIKQLKNDIDKSSQTIELLENQMLDSELKSDRIGILESSEKRLKNQVNANKKNEEQTLQLAEGLKKAKSKNKTLSRENYQLKQNIKKLSNASEKQLALIKKISNELEKANQLEEYQNRTISDLEKKLTKEIEQDSGSDKAKALEQELQEMNSKLERTIREKEFIESHLIEMDKTLEKSKETEAAIDQSREKISAIEETYPEFEVNEESLNVAESKPSKSAPNAPLPKISIDADNDPELDNIVKHNRLFGIIHEYWNSHETPPMHLLAEDNITRPDDLHHWVTTPLGHHGLSVIIGIHSGLVELLKTLEGKKQDKKDITLEQTLLTIGQKTATTLIEELNNDYTMGKSKYSEKASISNLFENAAVAAEALQEARNEHLYAAIIQVSE